MARIFITGSTDGIGRAAALALLASGHQVVLHARTSDRARAVADLGSRCLGVVIGDLRSADETRGIASQVHALGRMDAVIYNAGIYLEKRRGSTPEGHATVLAVNVLAPYVLTALIRGTPRWVFTSSGLHRNGDGSLRDMDWTERPWDAATAYAESKLYVAALAFALARRWPAVFSNAVDPGWVRTRMGGAAAPVDVDTGQRTQTWLASSDDAAARTSGRYWHHMRQETPAPEVTDVGFQDRLVARLGELTGVPLPDQP